MLDNIKFLKRLNWIGRRPRNAKEWFLRRLALSGELEQFLGDLREYAESNGVPRGIAFLDVAKQFYGYSNKLQEMDKCELAEINLVNRCKKRARMVQWSKEECMKIQEIFDDKPDVSFSQQIRWAWENWMLYTRQKEDSGNRTIISKIELAKSCPGPGAYGMVSFACDDLKAFQALCARVLLKEEKDQEVAEKAEAAAAPPEDDVEDLKRFLGSINDEE